MLEHGTTLRPHPEIVSAGTGQQWNEGSPRPSLGDQVRTRLMKAID